MCLSDVPTPPGRIGKRGAAVGGGHRIPPIPLARAFVCAWRLVYAKSERRAGVLVVCKSGIVARVRVVGLLVGWLVVGDVFVCVCGRICAGALLVEKLK